ncbi:MAG TPA: hypothetical protein VHH35_06180 [Pyrinomonadaceae bacterium]|nr:hypothetical protein [Pyrinomonadaceae bacterium]
MQHSLTKSTSFGKRHLVLFLAIVIGIMCSALSALPGWHAGAQVSINDQIAFDRGGNITLINSDGTGIVSHGPGFGPSFSPDGAQIVFSVHNADTSFIYKMNSNGTGLVRLNHLFTAQSPAWSPDGTQIAVVSEQEDPEYQTGEDLYTTPRLYLMDTAGNNPKKVMTRAQSHTDTHIIQREFAPTWSPDGSQLAFIGFTSTASGVTRENLYVVNRDGSAVREVTHFENGAFLVSSKISWSPDGTKIAFGLNRDIYLVSIDGLSQPINLTNTTDREERDPVFSPGGRRLAYIVNHVDDLLDGVYIMKADGQDPTQILSSSAANRQQVNRPAWNPLAQDPESSLPPPPPPLPSPYADMSISMTAPAQGRVGETMVYTLIVKNNGTADVSNSFAAFRRSPNLDLVSVTPGTCQPSASVPLGTDCTLGALANGAWTTVTIAVRPTAVGEVGITGTVGASLPDPDMTNNSQTVNVTVEPPPPCVPEVTSEVVQAISRPGSQTASFVKHTIYVQNTSGRPLNGLVHFVFEGLHPTISETGTAFPRTRCAEPVGRPYKTVSVSNLVWQPSGVIMLEVNFYNPFRVPVNYNLRIYTGPNFP